MCNREEPLTMKAASRVIFTLQFNFTSLGCLRLLGSGMISAFAGALLTVTNLSTTAVVISACCASGKLGCYRKRVAL